MLLGAYLRPRDCYIEPLSGVHYLEIPIPIFAPFLPAVRTRAELIAERIHNLPNADWIRLCKIKNTTDDGIDFTLEQFLLAEAPPYRALSYTWGSAEGVAEDATAVMGVEVEIGSLKRTVPRNLARALTQLRDWGEESYFWIDSFCINQLSPVEQCEQVNIMDKIYLGAVAVDVWLGASNNETKSVLAILEYLSSMRRRDGNVWSGLLAPKGVRPSFLSAQSVLPDDD